MVVVGREGVRPLSVNPDIYTYPLAGRINGKACPYLFNVEIGNVVGLGSAARRVLRNRPRTRRPEEACWPETGKGKGERRMALILCQ